MRNKEHTGFRNDQDWGIRDEEADAVSIEAQYDPKILGQATTDFETFEADLDPDAIRLVESILQTANEMYENSVKIADWNNLLKAISEFVQEYPLEYSDPVRKHLREKLARQFEELQH